MEQSIEEMCRQILTPRYKDARNRLRRAKVLLIDEISQLNSRSLLILDCIARVVRDSSKPVGGLQVKNYNFISKTFSRNSA